MVEAAYLSTFTPKNLENDWIVDSGCSHHITRYEKLCSSLQFHDRKKAIITTDNLIHHVEKEGIVIINGDDGSPITLKNVYNVSIVQKTFSPW